MGYTAPDVGTMCLRTARPPKKGQPPVPSLPAHEITSADDDADLQKVRQALMAIPNVKQLLTEAVMDSVDYILDGARTGRFDLMDANEVDSDERSAVGVQVQYRILSALNLPKMKPLDTFIVGVAVDIKNTVGSNWMIPKEAQCEICLLIQIDATKDLFAARLMRTHEAMLNPGGNQDSKRTIIKDAQYRYAVNLFAPEWAPLPHNPLRDLTPAQRDVVFDPKMGQKKRFIALFGFLPGVIIPRRVIQTVGARNDDPLRRVRQAKPDVLAEHGLVMLCETWPAERASAREAGFELAKGDWVAIPARALT